MYLMYVFVFNVLNVLNVFNVFNVFNVLNVLNVLNVCICVFKVQFKIECRKDFKISWPGRYTNQDVA